MAKARVLTRSELAEHLGVDKKMVTKWERSGMPVRPAQPASPKELRLPKSGSNSSTRAGYAAATNT